MQSSFELCEFLVRSQRATHCFPENYLSPFFYGYSCFMPLYNPKKRPNTQWPNGWQKNLKKPPSQKKLPAQWSNPSKCFPLLVWESIRSSSKSPNDKNVETPKNMKSTSFPQLAENTNKFERSVQWSNKQIRLKDRIYKQIWVLGSFNGRIYKSEFEKGRMTTRFQMIK